MVLRQIRIGPIANAIQYDDADYDSAIETSQPVKAGTPVDPNDVVRLGDVNPGITNLVSNAGTSTDSNIAEFDGATGKIIKDGGLSHANVADAISKKHTQGTDTALGVLGTKNPPIGADKVIYRDSIAADALVTSTWTQIKAFLKDYFDTLYGALGLAHTRLHSIIDVLDHSSAATSNQMLKANANGLPIDATNTDAEVVSAISLKHTQGTDIKVGSLSVYANNAAAVAGGLAVNDLYRNGADPDLVCVVH